MGRKMKNKGKCKNERKSVPGLALLEILAFTPTLN